MTAINTDLLASTLITITLNPDEWEQDSWDNVRPDLSCGSTGCVAHHMVVIAGWTPIIVPSASVDRDIIVGWRRNSLGLGPAVPTETAAILTLVGENPWKNDMGESGAHLRDGLVQLFDGGNSLAKLWDLAEDFFGVSTLPELSSLIRFIDDHRPFTDAKKVKFIALVRDLTEKYPQYAIYVH